MTKLSAIGVAAIALVLSAAPVRAHHSMIAEFDVRTLISLTGTITKMEWMNPHGWIYIDVKRENGKVEKWAIETGSPFQMTKRGLSAMDFKSGTTIIVGAFQSKTKPRTAAGWIITFPDRETSEAAGQASFALGR